MNLTKQIHRARKLLNLELNNPSYNPKRTLESVINAMKELAREDVD